MGNVIPSSRRRVRYQFVLFFLIARSSIKMYLNLRARFQSRIRYCLSRARVLVVIFRTIRQLSESNLKLGTDRSSSHISNSFFMTHPTIRHYYWRCRKRNEINRNNIRKHKYKIFIAAMLLFCFEQKQCVCSMVRYVHSRQKRSRLRVFIFIK